MYESYTWWLSWFLQLEMVISCSLALVRLADCFRCVQSNSACVCCYSNRCDFPCCSFSSVATICNRNTNSNMRPLYCAVQISRHHHSRSARVCIIAPFSLALARSRTHSFRHRINSIRYTMQTSIIIYITHYTYYIRYTFRARLTLFRSIARAIAMLFILLAQFFI